MIDETDLKTPDTGADTGGNPGGAVDTGDRSSDPGASSKEPMLGDTSDEDRKVVTPAEWPSDWRIKMAGGDEKLAKRLERFTDPSKVTQSWLSAEQKISSGEYKRPPDEGATEEQKAEWRKAMGVPDDPTGYKPSDVGIEWSDEDQPMLNAFFEEMHKTGATQAQIDAALAVYGKAFQESQIERQEADKAYLQQNEDKLRAKLGDEFRPQINLLKRMAEDKDGPIPGDVWEAIMTARDGEGNRVINNAEVASFLIDIGLNHYGDSALISGDAKVSMQSRIDEIKQVMKTDIRRYYDEGLDKEYAKLLERQIGKGKQSGPNYYDP